MMRVLQVTIGILAAMLFLPNVGIAEEPPRADSPSSQNAPFLVEQEPGASGGSIVFGPAVGITGPSGGTLIGHEYTFSLNGPLLLSAQVDLVLIGKGLELRLIPGIKYRLERDLLFGSLMPHVRAGLATHLFFGDDPQDSVAVTARLGGGLRYFFTENLGTGADLDLHLGTAAGDDMRALVGFTVTVAFEYLIN